MKKVKNSLIGLIIFIVIILSSLLFLSFKLGYVGKLKINDNYIGFVTKQDIDKYVYAVMSDEDYVFDNKDLDAVAVNYTFATNDMFDNFTFGQFLKGAIIGYDCHFEIIKVIDSEKVISWLNDYNTTQTQPISAYIEKTDTFKIIPEKLGTVIDINAVLKEITPYKYNHIRLDDFVQKPEVITTDLEELCMNANAYATWSCTYTNGMTISSDIDKVWIDDEYGIIYDDGFIEEQISNCLDSYNGKPDFINFRTTDGREIHVPNATLEAKVDTVSEVTALKKAMKEKSVLTDRLPCFIIDNAEMGNTYVEVSIPQQHLWYYKDGEIVLECAIVTGQVGVHDTPPGCYYITQMINGTYLIGEEYNNWVNRWMRLTVDGIGIHDANWRTSFGGDIYKTDGSHGCVNMPNLKAAELYKLVDLGTIVIIHE